MGGGRRAPAALGRYAAFLTGLVGLLVGALVGSTLGRDALGQSALAAALLPGPTTVAAPGDGAADGSGSLRPGEGSRGSGGGGRRAGGAGGGLALTDPPAHAADNSSGLAVDGSTEAPPAATAGGQEPWRLFLASQNPQAWEGPRGKPWDRLPDPPANPRLSVNESVLWGWRPLLDPAGLARGVHSLGHPTRMRRLVERLLKGEPVTVVTLGTSITAGAGSSSAPGVDTDWPAYPQQLLAWLRAAFPASNATLVNLGQAGVSTIFFDACGPALMPQEPDLVIVETVSRLAPEVDSPWNAAYERLLRRLLRAPTAAVALHPYAHRRADRHFFNSVENEANVVSAYYGVPILSMRSALFHLIAEGREGYQEWGRKDVLASQDNGDPLDVLYWDELNPYGPTGHRYLAELVISLIQRTAALLSAEPPEEDDGRGCPPLPPLPPPMLPGNYERAPPGCLLRDGLKAALTSCDGFDWASERPDAATLEQQRWGWVASRPGAWAAFTLDTRTTGTNPSLLSSQLPAGNASAFVPRNSNLTDLATKPVFAAKLGLANLLVGYQASSSGWGGARVECLEGCACEPSEFGGAKQAQQGEASPAGLMHEVLVTPHAECRVNVTLLGTSGDQGGGQGADGRLRISSLVVVPPGAFDFKTHPDRLEAPKRPAAAGGAGVKAAKQAPKAAKESASVTLPAVAADSAAGAQQPAGGSGSMS